jgi:hypothetical protein
MKLNKEQRKMRVIARGEHSNHSHVVCGEDVTIREEKGTVFVTVGNSGAVLRHLLESEYIETGNEVWTKEHLDIPLSPGEYKYVAQIEYNPLDETIQRTKD